MASLQRVLLNSSSSLVSRLPPPLSLLRLDRAPSDHEGLSRLSSLGYHYYHSVGALWLTRATRAIRATRVTRVITVRSGLIRVVRVIRVNRPMTIKRKDITPIPRTNFVGRISSFPRDTEVIRVSRIREG